MTRLLLLVAVFALVAQTPLPPDCPERRDWWNCGQVEHACSRDGHRVEGDATRYWHKCTCKQQCRTPGDEDNKAARFTDRTCKTRCKLNHCHCPQPHCET